MGNAALKWWADLQDSLPDLSDIQATVLVGLIGFSGVILSIILTSWLQRKLEVRRAFDAEQQVKKEKEERLKAVLSSISIELGAWISTIEGNMDQAPDPGGGVMIPVDTFDPVLMDRARDILGEIEAIIYLTYQPPLPTLGLEREVRYARYQPARRNGQRLSSHHPVQRTR